jgi:hypothetical protein
LFFTWTFSMSMSGSAARVATEETGIGKAYQHFRKQDATLSGHDAVMAVGGDGTCHERVHLAAEVPAGGFLGRPHQRALMVLAGVRRYVKGD